MCTVRQLAPIGTLLAAMAVAAGTVVGQNPTNQGEARPGGFATITGVVDDSIRGRHLNGAVVVVDGSLRQGVSDSLGRFRIDSVEPGWRQLGVFHPLLDSLSVGIATSPLNLTAGSTAFVVLGTPSAETVSREFCRNQRPEEAGVTGPSLLTGRILDADTDEPIVGARVELTWVHLVLSSAGLHRVRAMRDTITGAAGEFHFCQLPNLQFLIRAARGAAFSPENATASEVVAREFDMGHHLIGIVVLHLPGVTLASTPSTSPVSGGATLSGRVRHADGRPAVGARVAVLGSADSAITSDSGRFELHGLRPGTRTLVVRALGFEPVATTIEISSRAPHAVNVALGMKIAVLDSIKVVGQLKAGYVRVGFDHRKLAGLGYFLTADEVANRQPTMFHDIFVAVPGVHVLYGHGQPVIRAARGGGSCVTYVVDGFPYHETQPGDVDSYVFPEEIGAIEVYDATEVPGEFRSTLGVGNFGCAVIVVWTKTRLGL